MQDIVVEPKDLESCLHPQAHDTDRLKISVRCTEAIKQFLNRKGDIKSSIIK